MFVLSKRIGSSASQGSTLMWVEEYGERPVGVRAAFGALRTMAFAVAMAVLAHGAAFFIGWQRFH
jgi:hypothetical protein